MQDASGRRGSLVDFLDAFSYRQIFLLWVVTVACFALIYTILSFTPPNGPTPIEGQIARRFLTSAYYSVITATNTGYGDIVPHGVSRLFAALEAFVGLFLFAFFMAKLVSRYQDVAIRQMHTISFQRTFHNMREDFYVVRRDFELVMHHLSVGKTPSREEWDRLTVAYKQIASLLYEIPDFYDYEYQLYIIDERREELLMESLNRTLQRLVKLIDMVKERGISWKQEKEYAHALKDLGNALDIFIPELQKKVRPTSKESLDGTDASRKRIQVLLYH